MRRGAKRRCMDTMQMEACAACGVGLGQPVRVGGQARGGVSGGAYGIGIGASLLRRWSVTGVLQTRYAMLEKKPCSFNSRATLEAEHTHFNVLDKVRLRKGVTRSVNSNSMLPSTAAGSTPQHPTPPEAALQPERHNSASALQNNPFRRLSLCMNAWHSHFNRHSRIPEQAQAEAATAAAPVSCSHWTPRPAHAWQGAPVGGAPFHW